MEAALAHTISSAVERAYALSDLFDKRRELSIAEVRCELGNAGMQITG